MTQPTKVRLRRMESDDLARVLEWRNHSDVRKFMYTQHEISLAEHTRWFERASVDPDRHLLIFEAGDLPSGFVNLHRVGAGGVAEWGFYLAPDAPAGTGRQLGHTALAYAFDVAGLHKLCGEALAYNARSIRFHERLGFRQEGVLRHQHFDGLRYHDVIRFGLLSTEWSAPSRKEVE